MGRATCFTPDVLLWLRHVQAVRSKMVGTTEATQMSNVNCLR
jgi:hypothetical protein